MNEKKKKSGAQFRKEDRKKKLQLAATQSRKLHDYFKNSAEAGPSGSG